jgi:hypothetical protein
MTPARGPRGCGKPAPSSKFEDSNADYCTRPLRYTAPNPAGSYLSTDRLAEYTYFAINPLLARESELGDHQVHNVTRSAVRIGSAEEMNGRVDRIPTVWYLYRSCSKCGFWIPSRALRSTSEWLGHGHDFEHSGRRVAIAVGSLTGQPTRRCEVVTGLGWYSGNCSCQSVDTSQGRVKNEDHYMVGSKSN